MSRKKQQDKEEELGLVQHQQTLHTLRNTSIIDRSLQKANSGRPSTKARASESPAKQSRRASSKTKEKQEKPSKSGVTKRKTAQNTAPIEFEMFSSQEISSEEPQFLKEAAGRQAQQRGGSRSPSPRGGSRLGIRKALKNMVKSPWKKSETAKSSSMKRELDNLNLSASKEYAFIADYSRDRPKAMDDPNVYYLRDGQEARIAKARKRRGSISPSGRGRGGQRGYSQRGEQSNICSTSVEFIQENVNGSHLVALLALILLWLLFIRPTPYCDTTNPHFQQSCSPTGWYWPWECRPCPLHAHCSNGQMMCLSDYQDIGGQVCIAQDDNPYIAKVVHFLMEVDEGIRWNQNFKHFGAAHPQKITVEEILTKLRVQGANDRSIAGSAILAVLKDKGGLDQYCLAKKFATQNLDDFVDWSDIAIASLKLGMTTP